jgi:acyl carrier protein
MPLPSQRDEQAQLRQLIRERLRSQVPDLPATTSDDEDLQLAGAQSLDLIVVLSQLEHELEVTLDDVFVAKGYTIGGLAARVWAARRATARPTAPSEV